MQGVSRESLAAAQEQLDALLGAAGTDGAAIGGALFAVVDLLDANVALRRSPTDPSHSADAKAALAARLLEGKVSADVLELVSSLVRARWSRARDLGDSVEHLAASALVAGAERAGRPARAFGAERLARILDHG